MSDDDDDDDFVADMACVTPNCCGKAACFGAVFIDAQETFDGSPSPPPIWMTHFEDARTGNISSIEAEFCPFCGKPLPEIVAVVPPRPVRKFTDGCYYCDVCGQRGSACRCLMPDKAWGPKCT